MPERPTLDQYFMDMTHLVKARGTCPRRQVGAVIVKDKRVLTTGYNGAPRNFPHPTDVGCLRDELQIPRGMVADICPCLHAEQNAILQAATTGVSIEGADVYCTTQPCTQCSRLIANCGIRRVVFHEEYPDALAVGILTTAGVQLWRWDAQAREARRVERPNTFEQAQDEVRRRFAAGALTVASGRALPMAGAVPVAMPAAGQAKADPAPVAVPATHAVAPGAIEADTQIPAPPPPSVRDLRDDPQRAQLIRRLAREKAAQRKADRDLA